MTVTVGVGTLTITVSVSAPWMVDGTVDAPVQVLVTVVVALGTSTTIVFVDPLIVLVDTYVLLQADVRVTNGVGTFTTTVSVSSPEIVDTEGVNPVHVRVVVSVFFGTSTITVLLSPGPSTAVLELVNDSVHTEVNVVVGVGTSTMTVSVNEPSTVVVCTNELSHVLVTVT